MPTDLVFTAPVSQDTPLLDGDTEATVTVDLSTTWGVVYSGPQWYLNTPEGSSATLTPGGAAAAPQSFTPDVPGRYLIRADVTRLSDSAPVTLTALYEVESALIPDFSLPAFQETDEAGDARGWGAEIHKGLNHLGKWSTFRQVVVGHNGSGFAIVAGEVCQFATAAMVDWGGPTNTPSTGASTEQIVSVEGTDASTDSITLDTKLLALEPVATGAKGLFLVRGIVPFTTTGWSPGDTLFATDAGTVTDTAGTYARELGIVLSTGLAADPAPGTIFFDGLGLEMLTELVPTREGTPSVAEHGAFLSRDDTLKRWVRKPYLAQRIDSATGTAVSNTVVETLSKSYTLPAHDYQVNDELIMEVQVDVTSLNPGDTVTLRVKVDGQTVSSDDFGSLGVDSSNIKAVITTAGATGVLTPFKAPTAASPIDWTTPPTVEFTLQWDNADPANSAVVKLDDLLLARS
jgi:hypothetical protein